ncbi:MAG: WbqC family protein [Pseudomonadota bacterium]
MKKVVVILQSNYLPWKGYLDLLNAADTFVLFDEVQFTRRDWRNRNKVIVGGAPKWLTIPVDSKGKYDARVDEMRIADPAWAEKHWQTVRHAYSKAPYWSEYGHLLQKLYIEADELEMLSQVNRLFLKALAEWFGIETTLAESTEVPRVSQNPSERLIEICKGMDATDYVSGPAAKAYIDRDRFAAEGIALHYADYSGYPEYSQASTEFIHGVSAIDLLMQTGPDARGHLKSRRAFEGVTEAVSPA